MLRVQRVGVLMALVILTLTILPVPTAAQDDRPLCVIPVQRHQLITALSPDGSTLAAFENPNRQMDFIVDPDYLPIQLVDITTGTVTRLSGHNDYASSAAFTADGATLVTYHINGEIIVWDVASASSARRFHAWPSIETIALSADGHTLVLRTAANYVLLSVWDLELGHITALLSNTPATYAEFWQRANSGPLDYALIPTLSADGQTVIAPTSYGNIWQWDLATGEQRLLRASGADSPQLPIRSVSLVADGSRIVFLHMNDDQVIVMDSATGDELHKINTSTTHLPASTPDGTRIAWLDMDARAIMVWNAARPDDLQTITGYANIESIALRGIQAVPHSLLPTLYLTPDGQQVIFAGLWAPDTGNNAITVMDVP